MPNLTKAQRRVQEELFKQGKKRCTKCDEIKSISEFGPSKTGWRNLRSTCRECNRDYLKDWHNKNPDYMKFYLRQWRAKNPEKEAAQTKRWREKNPGYFSALAKKKWQDPIERVKSQERARRYYESHKEIRQKYACEYRLKNREKIRESNCKYRAEHRDERKAYNQRYFQEHKLKRQIYNKQWRANNLEKTRSRERKWYAKNRHKILKQKRKRYAENPSIPMARKARYTARKAGAGGSFTAEEWQVLCEKHNHRCLCCGKKKLLESDHIIPISEGGSSDIENIQPLCRSCNASKGTQTIDYR
jgi:5-methylcytosine-specific restriction endonuclease McrA